MYRNMNLLPTEAMRKDPRVRDQTFVHESINKLFAFLVKSNYNHPISRQQLQAPSVKDFKLIFMFMYNRLDPSYQFNGKYEEEIPMLIRVLG